MAHTAEPDETDRCHGLVHILDRAGRGADRALRQRCRHELVEVAVEHARRVRGLHAGTQVLHHLVGLQHVGADLAPPADLGLLSRRLVRAELRREAPESEVDPGTPLAGHRLDASGDHGDAGRRASGQGDAQCDRLSPRGLSRAPERARPRRGRSRNCAARIQSYARSSRCSPAAWHATSACCPTGSRRRGAPG